MNNTIELFIGTFCGLGLIMFAYTGFDFVRMKYTIWRRNKMYKTKLNGHNKY